MNNSNGSGWKNDVESKDGLKNIFKVRTEMLSLRKQLRTMIKMQIAVYSEIIKREPLNVKAYLGRAKCQRLINNFNMSVGDCTKVLEINPEYFAAYDERGFCYFLLKDYGRAMDDYSKLLEIRITDEWYYFRGVSKSKLKMYPEAIKDFTEVIKLGKSERPEVIFKRGYCYLKSEKYDEAINDLLKAVKLDCMSPKYLYNLGEAFRLKGNIIVANEVFELEKELKPLAEVNDSETEEGI